MRAAARKALSGPVLILALGGCVIGPRYQPPPPPPSAALPSAIQAPTVASASAGGESQRFVDALDVPGRWWALFHSPALEAVVDDALKANADVEAAQAALRQARENVVVAQAGYYPTVGLSGLATHALNPSVLASPVFSGANQYSLWNAQANVAYAPDVFGAVRHGVEGARAQRDVQRFQLEATYLTLTANLVNACVQAAALKEEIARTKGMIADQKALLAALERAFAAGQAARGDVLRPLRWPRLRLPCHRWRSRPASSMT
jgi:outer membrane protein TolC